MIVVIDAGHGGSDSGAVYGKWLEKNLNLDLSKRIERCLVDNYDNVKVISTRVRDEFVSLDRRCAIANEAKADLFYSVHFNGGNGTGYEDFIHNNLSDGSKTNQLRTIVHTEISKVMDRYNIRNRGMKKANFQVLRDTRMSAILTESLFVNHFDVEWFNNEKFMNDLVMGHCNGIARALGLTKKRSNKWYKVQVGAFRDKKNAENLMKELKDKGYPVYLVEEKG